MAGCLERGLGAFGAVAVQVGELMAGLQLGGVGGVQGVAFAGGVRAGTLSLRAGVCFGLACAGDLGLGADPRCRRVVGGLAGLLLAGPGFRAGGGDRRLRIGPGGSDRRVGVCAGGCSLSLGLPGVCLGGLLQAAGGFQGFQGGLQFLVGFGGLGVRDDGSCLSAAAAGVAVGQLRADLGRVEPGGLSAGVPGQRGGLPEQGFQPGQRVTIWPCRQEGCHAGRVRAAGAGSIVVGAGARIAAVLPGPAVASCRDRGAAAGAAAVPHQVTGLPGGLIGYHG